MLIHAKEKINLVGVKQTGGIQTEAGEEEKKIAQLL